MKEKMRVLLVGAHPDDLEFRAAGLAMKFRKMGAEVKFLVLCNGSKGHHILSMEETVRTRAKEAAAVKEVLGLTEYKIWDINDCELEATLENRRRLIRDIREFAPDIVIGHRINDYHADHRAAAQLLQDASYMLIVPHDCPEAPAMRKMPVIMYFEDRFKEPLFRADVIVDVTEEMDQKVKAADKNVSQVYEWLPYSECEEAPTDPKARIRWLWEGVTPESSDEEIRAVKHNRIAARPAKTAARFREELIARYGENGKTIRFAEAFQLCEYGKQLSLEDMNALFPL